ncbi:hypothetical protein HanIR_Chr04g0194881 [Helianthus annuus]|nr:hypothetical protein HanIR_Chr04g0194881 [Helianthus annuus]
MINEEVKPKETNMKTLMNLHSAYKTTTVVGVLTCFNCFAAIRLEGMGFVPTPVELRPVLSVLCWTLVTILNWWAPSLLSYGTSKVTPSLSWLSLFSSGFSDILSAALKEGRKSRENRGEGLGLVVNRL